VRHSKRMSQGPVENLIDLTSKAPAAAAAAADPAEATMAAPARLQCLFADHSTMEDFFSNVGLDISDSFSGNVHLLELPGDWLIHNPFGKAKCRVCPTKRAPAAGVLEVFHSPIHHYGVRARAFIAAGTLLCWCNGEIRCEPAAGPICDFAI